MKDTLEIKQINELLKDIPSLRYRKKKIYSEVIKEVGGAQGEEGETIEVYDVGLPDGLFLKLNVGSDSYGSNEFVKSIEFVRGKEKQITVYEY